MSKSDRQRRRDRARREAPEGMDLAPVPKRSPSGRRRSEVGVRTVEAGKRGDDPAKVALIARCRQAGVEPTKGNRRDRSGPMDGDDMGRAIRDQIKRADAQLRYWRTWCDYDAACRAYRRSIHAPEVKGARLPVAPSREAPLDASLRIEEDDADRTRRLAAAYARWRIILAHEMSGPDAALLRSSQDGTGRPLWSEGSITPAGRHAVAALVRLTEAAER